MIGRCCEYCGKKWVPKPRQKWHTCARARAARHKKALKITQNWREKNPGYQAERKTTGVHHGRNEGAPRRCRRCGTPTWNYINCDECWHEIAAQTETPTECLGQELGSIWL